MYRGPKTKKLEKDVSRTVIIVMRKIEREIVTGDSLERMAKESFFEEEILEQKSE